MAFSLYEMHALSVFFYPLLFRPGHKFTNLISGNCMGFGWRLKRKGLFRCLIPPKVLNRQTGIETWAPKI